MLQYCCSIGSECLNGKIYFSVLANRNVAPFPQLKITLSSGTSDVKIYFSGGNERGSVSIMYLFTQRVSFARTVASPVFDCRIEDVGHVHT